MPFVVHRLKVETVGLGRGRRGGRDRLSAAAGVGDRLEERERHELRESDEHGAEGVTTTVTARPDGRTEQRGLRDSGQVVHGDDHRISSWESTPETNSVNAAFKRFVHFFSGYFREKMPLEPAPTV